MVWSCLLAQACGLYPLCRHDEAIQSMECDGISTQCCWLISHRPGSGGEDLFDCWIEQVPIMNWLSPTSRVCICNVRGDNAARGMRHLETR